MIEAQTSGGRLMAAELGQLARGGAIGLGGLVANGALTFAFFVIAGRSLPRPEAGALFEGIAALTIFGYVAMLGLDVGLLKLVPSVLRRTPARLTHVIVAGTLPPLLVGALLTATLLTFSSQLARFAMHGVARDTAVAELRAVAPFIPIAAVGAVAMAALRLWHIREAVLVQYLAVPVVRLGALLVLVRFRLSPQTATFAWGGAVVLGATLAVGLLAGRVRSHAQLQLDSPSTEPESDAWSTAASLWRFSGPRALGGVFQVLVDWFDVVLVGVLATTAAAATYGVSGRYAVSAILPLQAMGIAIAPQLSRLLADGRLREARELYQRSSCWVAALCWPPLVLCIVFAPLLMSFFGRGYGNGGLALQLLAIGMLVNAGTGNNSVALLLCGKSVASLGIFGAALVLNVVLDLALIPPYGASGAAAAASIAVISLAGATGIALYRSARMNPITRGYVVVAGAAAGSFGLVGTVARLGLGGSVAALAVAACVGSVVYLTALFVFGDFAPLSRSGALVSREGASA